MCRILSFACLLAAVTGGLAWRIDRTHSNFVTKWLEDSKELLRHEQLPALKREAEHFYSLLNQL